MRGRKRKGKGKKRKGKGMKSEIKEDMRVKREVTQSRRNRKGGKGIKC